MVLKRARLLCYLVLCVSRAVLSVVLGALSVRFVGWADWVDCRRFLSLVVLGVARRLELSPCNTMLAQGQLSLATMPLPVSRAHAQCMSRCLPRPGTQPAIPQHLPTYF